MDAGRPAIPRRRLSRREYGPRKTPLLIDLRPSKKKQKVSFWALFEPFEPSVFLAFLCTPSRGGSDLNKHAGKRSVFCPRYCSKKVIKMTFGSNELLWDCGA